MKEVARELFVSLQKDKYGMYFILNDQNFVMKFYAESDEIAIKKFQAVLNIKNEWNFNLKDFDFELNDDILTVSPSDYEEGDISVTLWQINIFSGEHRHKGVTEGCFWTNWKGGEDDD